MQGDLLPVIDVHGDQRAASLHFLLFFLPQKSGWGWGITPAVLLEKVPKNEVDPGKILPW